MLTEEQQAAVRELSRNAKADLLQQTEWWVMRAGFGAFVGTYLATEIRYETHTLHGAPLATPKPYPFPTYYTLNAKLATLQEGTQKIRVADMTVGHRHAVNIMLRREQTALCYATLQRLMGIYSDADDGARHSASGEFDELYRALGNSEACTAWLNNTPFMRRCRELTIAHKNARGPVLLGEQPRVAPSLLVTA